MPLPITSIAAAALLVLLSLLGLWVALYRMGRRIRFETGGDDEMVRRVRAHGNLAEYGAFRLVALALIELQAGDRTLLWGLAAGLVGGRVIHAVGLLAKVHLFRVLGMVSTVGMLLTAAVVLARKSGLLPLG